MVIVIRERERMAKQSAIKIFIFKSGVMGEREMEDDQHLIGAILRSYEIIERESCSQVLEDRNPPQIYFYI